MFSNTMIVIYKGCDNLCAFFFSNDTIYFFFHFIFSSSHTTYKKKTFYYSNINLVGPYCMRTEQKKMHQYFNLSRLWIKYFQRQAYALFDSKWGPF